MPLYPPSLYLLADLQYFVSPVSAVNFRDRDLVVPMAAGVSGVYTALLKDWLKSIIYGNEQHEWGVIIED